MLRLSAHCSSHSRPARTVMGQAVPPVTVLPICTGAGSMGRRSDFSPISCRATSSGVPLAWIVPSDNTTT